MHRALSLLTLGLMFFASHAYAHVELLDIHVLSFRADKEKDQYVLRFRAITTDYGDVFNLPSKERTFTIYFRIHPKDSSTGTAREGMEILQKRYRRGADIRIGRMSGKGWRAIPGRKGEFQSVGVQIHYPENSSSEDDAIAYFIHDSSY